MPIWIDTHCHLDAKEFGPNAQEIRAQAADKNVVSCVIPAVQPANFEVVRQLAHANAHASGGHGNDGYALGIHPLYVAQATEADLQVLDKRLTDLRDDPRLVAVGEIGLDFFVPALRQGPLREKQEFFYREQLKIARRHGLPVILHVRRSADVLLKHLRALARGGGATHRWSGIAHAFNGSLQQAQAFVAMGFKLGFGGAVTYAAAHQLRRLAAELPLEAIVLETDAPDIPPQWLYQTTSQRAAGVPQGINSPAELPRIAQVLADLRGIGLADLAEATGANARAALPRLDALLDA